MFSDVVSAVYAVILLLKATRDKAEKFMCALFNIYCHQALSAANTPKIPHLPLTIDAFGANVGEFGDEFDTNFSDDHTFSESALGGSDIDTETMIIVILILVVLAIWALLCCCCCKTSKRTRLPKNGNSPVANPSLIGHSSPPDAGNAPPSSNSAPYTGSSTSTHPSPYDSSPSSDVPPPGDSNPTFAPIHNSQIGFLPFPIIHWPCDMTSIPQPKAPSVWDLADRQTPDNDTFLKLTAYRKHEARMAEMSVMRNEARRIQACLNEAERAKERAVASQATLTNALKASERESEAHQNEANLLRDQTISLQAKTKRISDAAEAKENESRRKTMGLSDSLKEVQARESDATQKNSEHQHQISTLRSQLRQTVDDRDCDLNKEVRQQRELRQQIRQLEDRRRQDLEVQQRIEAVQKAKAQEEAARLRDEQRQTARLKDNIRGLEEEVSQKRTLEFQARNFDLQVNHNTNLQQLVRRREDRIQEILDTNDQTQAANAREKSSLHDQIKVLEAETREKSSLHDRIQVLEAETREKSSLQDRIKVLEAEGQEKSSLQSRIQVLEAETQEKSSLHDRIKALEAETREKSSLQGRIQVLEAETREKSSLQDRIQALEAEIQELRARAEAPPAVAPQGEGEGKEPSKPNDPVNEADKLDDMDYELLGETNPNRDPSDKDAEPQAYDADDPMWDAMFEDAWAEMVNYFPDCGAEYDDVPANGATEEMKDVDQTARPAEEAGTFNLGALSLVPDKPATEAVDKWVTTVTDFNFVEGASDDLKKPAAKVSDVVCGEQQSVPSKGESAKPFVFAAGNSGAATKPAEAPSDDESEEL